MEPLVGELQWSIEKYKILFDILSQRFPREDINFIQLLIFTIKTTIKIISTSNTTLALDRYL